MGTKKSKKKINGGSYTDKMRVSRSCTKYSSKRVRGNLSKCKCENTGDQFSYDNRFFECTENGFSLLDTSEVNERYAGLLDKILEFEETYQEYESREKYIKAVNDYINKEYRVLGLDVETKNFIREYILDDFKYRRRFKGEVGAKNTEILLKNLDKIKRKIIKRKKSKSTFTLGNLKEELKEIIKVLENHISQVNRLMKDDELNKQIKGDPFDFSGTKTDLDKILGRVKSGEITLSKQDLAEKINDAFKGVIKEILDILEKFTESNAIKKSVKLRLVKDFGDNSESQKTFYFKYNSSRESLMKFSVRFIQTVLDSEGPDSYKKFINKSKLIEFISMLVKYDSNFKEGSEKGVEKYFEGYSLSDIVSKIQSYTTLKNFITRERSVIQTRAGLKYSEESLNKLNSDNNESEMLMMKIKNIVREISKDDAEKLTDMINREGGSSSVVKKYKISNNTDSVKMFLTNFFSMIHENSDRLGRRLNSLRLVNI